MFRSCIHVEFQKRGLSYVHIYYFIAKKPGALTADEADKFISVQLLDLSVGAIGFDKVSAFMIHGTFSRTNSKLDPRESVLLFCQT